MKKQVFTFGLLLIVAVMIGGTAVKVLAANDKNDHSPYGVCAHLGGGEEHRQMPTNLKLMKEAGIDWVRADFSWGGVERPQGQWRFDHLDKLLDETEKSGISVLPILNYDVSWATPAYKHLDAWKKYVHQTVSRYKDRIRYWEVWNEPNLKGFWRDEPSGQNYAILLKATYETIKAIDPNLQVLYGGLAGVPVPYYEDSLKAGAGKYFDIINIHPYRGGLTTMAATKKLITDTTQFNDLLRQYNHPEKPIWNTEMGWATLPKLGEDTRRMINAAMKTIFPNGMKGKVAALIDSKYPYSESYSLADYQTMFPKEAKIETVQLNQLAQLKALGFSILILPPGEVFPSQYFDEMVRFVKEGGTLILTGGVPLFYETEEKEGLLLQKNNASDKFRNTLRIGWKAWWTVKGTPEKAPVHVSSESLALFPGYFPVLEGTRFLTNSLLKPGDKMIPLLSAKAKDFEDAVAAVYQFNSDYKGNLVVGTLSAGFANTNISTVENQAIYLPQAILIELCAGVERFFCYEFQAPEQDEADKESFFGIVHRDLSPKPGYIAYQALTKARPAGSIQSPHWEQADCCVVSWKRPDGQMGWAIWSPLLDVEKQITLKGAVTQSFNYLGEKVDFDPSAKKINISQKIIYLIGPDSIELK